MTMQTSGTRRRRSAVEGSGPARPATLLDQVLPVFDVRSAHDLVVPVSTARAAAAVESYRVDSSPVVRGLFWLRGLGPAPTTLRTSLTRHGFTILAEKAGEEIVLGVVGRFWALRELENLRAVDDLEAFVAFDRPGWAKGAINIRCEALSPERTRLSTETRVQCIGPTAQRCFARYWLLIKPFSGLIRRRMLAGIAREALAASG
jgi:hypothetical protein